MKQTKSIQLVFFLALGAFLLLYFNHSKTHLFSTNYNTITNHLLSHKPAHDRDHANDVAHHPLDPLTVQELNRVRTILSSHALFRSAKSYAINYVALNEPLKPRVLRWKVGDPLPPRKASVIAHVDGVSHVLVVDLGSGRVKRVETGPLTGYPTPTKEDWAAVRSAVFGSAEFNRSITKRGVDLADVVCPACSPGWFGKNEEKRRLAKVQCFSTKDTANFYMRPIEGLTVLVDIDKVQVVQIIDNGKDIPIPTATNTDYRLSAQNNITHQDNTRPINPISIEQPKGPSFIVENNHNIKWANWEFHLKPDPRAGLIVSRAMFRDPDSGELRSVIYKGMVSEMFVPYMDPTESWYFKTYMDVGEYGFGSQAKTLDPLNDCPRYAHYMDGVIASGDGRPYVKSNIICVFESYGGDIGWRHSEGEEIREVRPKVTLVARMVATVGNYDYIVDWKFQSDGLIQVQVGLSGIAVVKGVTYKNNYQVPKQENLYGTLVSENIVGVIHDHYITFYLDIDVDGSNNSFVKLHLQRQETFSKSPRRSYIKAVRQIAKTEKDAQIKLKLYDPYEFHVVNPNIRTRVGNPPGYKLVPSGNAASLLDVEDPPQKRAGFTNNQIWITPYNRSEIWAGGLFVCQNHGEDNLATWSSRNRQIENEDIVMWYTLGFHHIPCQEDFPVMPTVTSSFDLKPVNFFSRNPILRIPPNYEKDLPTCQATASA